MSQVLQISVDVHSMQLGILHYYDMLRMHYVVLLFVVVRVYPLLHYSHTNKLSMQRLLDMRNEREQVK